MMTSNNFDERCKPLHLKEYVQKLFSTGKIKDSMLSKDVLDRIKDTLKEKV